MSESIASQSVRYACMPRPLLVDGALSIEAVQPAHIERIRQWRNAQMDVLRQSSYISPEQQETYFAQHIWPETSSPCPRNLLLAYKDGGRLVGYGGLVHIAWEHRRAEVSFLLDSVLATSDQATEHYFREYLGLIKALAFMDLGMHRLCTETYAFRSTHLAVLESSGFQREGILRDHIRIAGRYMNSIVHGCLAKEEKAFRL